MTSSPDAPVLASYQEKVAERFEALLLRLPEQDREVVARAFRTAAQFHEGQTRRSGEPYILHPLEVAHLLCDLNMDQASIVAGILHDVLEDTKLSYDDLVQGFGKEVAELVDGVTKIGGLDFETRREALVKNLRKIIAAMAQDIRVIIIKLCDRLHNMRTLASLPPPRQEAIARETMEIYAPLANRLGIVKIKSELEDLCMRHLYSEEYSMLKQMVAKKRTERENQIQKAIEYLQEKLAEKGVRNVSIQGRSKHFYSIFRKMQKSNLSFDEIFDLHALRIHCETTTDCYAILGIVHELWKPIDGRFKDYIAMPKPNGYKSIHTTVMGLGGVRTEIQIRTYDMHKEAEYGIAAHWKYKQGGSFDQNLDRRLEWLRRTAEWAMEPGNSRDFLEGLKKDVFADIVMCCTPRGDIVELPAGATPIDFAYAIHTHVGERCVGAKVNGRMVSLRTRLKSGDRVEITTSEQGHPSHDWLEVVVTNRARSKIRQWFKSKEADRYMAEGRATLERLLKERGFEVNKEELEKALMTLLEPFRMVTVQDVLTEIGFGTISAQAALSRMNPDWGRPAAPKRQKERQQKEGAILVGNLGSSVDDDSMKIASCCRPIPGDPIVAFVTRGRSLRIHAQNCKNIERLSKDPEESQRLLPAEWDLGSDSTHTVFLRIVTWDRKNLLADMTAQISRPGASIQQCRTKSYKEKGTAVMHFEVDVEHTTQLETILAGIRAIPSVIRAERVTKFPESS